MGDIIQFPPPSMPADLAAEVRLFTSAFNPAYAECAVAPATPHPAAAEWLRRRQALLAEPTVYEHCHAWFELLCCGINGVNEYLFEQRERAIWSMCRDLPACVWCERTVHMVWSRTSFLPSAAECREELSAYLLSLQREVRALERIVQAPPTRPVVSEPYVLPRPPEWALTGPTHQGPQRDFAAEFQAKQGRVPGSLSKAMLEAVRSAAKTKTSGASSPPTAEPRPIADAAG